jgi:hypothetical protein
MTQMKKKIAAATVVAALALGGAGAIAVGAVGAQEDQPRRDGPLAGLVADGTLTQEQADAVRDAAREHRGDRREHRRAVVAAAAEAIGIPPEDLVARVRAGETIAEVAEAEGVDPQTVRDAIAAARGR